MYEKILVPLDGSELAENTALPYVESVAGAFDSEIILTNVTGLSEIDLGRLYSTYLDGVARKLEAELEAIGKRPRVGWEVLSGKPAEEILKAADRNKANLIVLSSAGRSGPGRWVLGAVATKLLRASSLPILLIKAREEAEAAKPFQSILVPLDGSPEAEVVLPHVASLATKIGSRVTIFEAIDMASLGPTEFAGYSESAVRGLEATVTKYVCGIRDQLKGQGLTGECTAEKAIGPAADEIVDYAEKHDIDLIAMATHGRSGVKRWVFGSVAEKVLHAVHIPILLVRVQK